MSLTETGRFLHAGEEVAFATMVSDVLRNDLGERRASIKQVARWTGAGERTVKNWFAASCAPRGHHFRALVRHCPGMLDAFLASAGRIDRLASVQVHEARQRLLEAVAVLDLLAAQPPE